MSEEPLADLLVVDLSEGVSGAYCCKLLADCGTEVIKVERPDSGDPSRAHGPFPDHLPHPEKSALFLHLNAGKKGITLDIGQATGALLLRRLVERADALVENLTPGYLESRGLGYQDLSRSNPRLLMTSVTPSLHSEGYQAEYLAGLNAFAATMVGLVGVAVSEVGQHIEVAGIECLAAASLSTGTAQGRPEEIMESPLAAEPVHLQEIEHPLAGRLAYPRAPFRASGTVDQIAPAPLLGEHNEEVYCELLGLARSDLSPLRAVGVI
jgi:crotonobetainyl-CoA:carnitine CoA-transferase CaiB-like acyl-CoA transferase